MSDESALLARASFFGYWLYDNLAILAKIKFIKGDAPGWNKTGMLFWFFGNLFGFVSDLRKLAQINTQGAYFRKLIKESPEKAEVFKEKFKGLEVQRGTAIRGLLKSGFDGLTSFGGSGKEILFLCPRSRREGWNHPERRSCRIQRGCVRPRRLLRALP